LEFALHQMIWLCKSPKEVYVALLLLPSRGASLRLCAPTRCDGLLAGVGGCGGGPRRFTHRRRPRRRVTSLGAAAARSVDWRVRMLLQIQAD
jgi:hypothetical protein